MMSHETDFGFSTPSAFDGYDTVNGAADHAEDRAAAAAFTAKQVQVTILAGDEPVGPLTSDEAREILTRVWNPSELGTIEAMQFDGDFLVDFRADTATVVLAEGFSGIAQRNGVRYDVEIEPTAR